MTNHMAIELRSIVGPESIDATDEGVIFGLAIPYNKVTTIGDMAHGGFREQIAPGSCTKSMREADIVALFNHDSGKPLGRTSAGNLKLTNTTRGVEPELTPVHTTYAADLAELVNSKTIKGWSFGFEVVKDDWTDPEGRASDEYSGTDRIIREMKLIEVSPVTFPAYGDGMTNISSRDAVAAARESRGRVWEDRSIDKAMMYMGDVTSFLIDAFNELTKEQLALMPETIRTALVDFSVRASDASKPYGDVTYADPGYQTDGKKRYPIDTAAHAKAAWSYINKASNAGAYSATQLAAIKGRIKGACKKFGIEVNDQNEMMLANEWRCYRKEYQIVERQDGSAKDAKVKPAKKKNHDDKGNANADNVPHTDESADDEPDQKTDNQGNPKSKKAKVNKKFSDQAKGKTTPNAVSQPTQSNSAENNMTKRDVPKGMSDGTAKRIPQINAALNQALTLFAKSESDDLSPELKQAIALVSSAATHAGHIMNHEGMDPTDAISDADAKDDGRSTRDANEDVTTDDIESGNADDFAVCEACGYINPMDADVCEQCGDPLGNPTGRAAKTAAIQRNAKPEPTTSPNPLTDDALRLAYAQAVSREIDLGI